MTPAGDDDAAQTSQQSSATVAELLAERWGLVGRVVPLGSLQDSVYRVLGEGDRPLAAVRVSTGDVDEAGVLAEARVVAHLADTLPRLDLPTLRPAADGKLLQWRNGSSTRLMRWVRGLRLADRSRLPDQAAAELGSLAGQVSRALRGLDEAPLRRYVEWDPRHAVAVTEEYLDRCPADLRDDVDRALARARTHLPDPGSTVLEQQVVHLDVTDLNVLGAFGDQGTFQPTGLVDFEDMTWTWRLCELAVTVHAVIGRRPEDPLGALKPVLVGYLRHRAVSEAEADVLWDLVLARSLVCAVVEAVEAAAGPGNGYAVRLAALDAVTLHAVLGVDATFARAVVRDACGHGTAPVEPAVPVLSDRVRLLAHSGPGGYQTMAELTDRERDAVHPDAMWLGTLVRVDDAAEVVAPCPSTVHEAAGTSVVLRLEPAGDVPAYLRVEGLAVDVGPGTVLAAGDRLGQVPAGRTSLHVQLLADPSLPSRGKVRDAELWRRLCPDPEAFLPATAQGLEPAGRGDTAVRRRSRHVAPVQRMYFRSPPLMLSGRGQWMYDSTGRRYLDMVNNVAIAGHSHPRITAAAAEQLDRLATNSRFLYDAIADYADKIVATLPPELDTVLFVNSGSEAVELALQMARSHTGRHDVVVVDGTYHGWTTELMELGTIEADRPDWRQRLAPWVHVADAPDPFRGAHGDDVSAYVRSVEDRCADAAPHGGPAAFLTEAVLGNRGGVVPPPGYLEAAFAAVRRHGGLCIADEVQVGFARTGATFWAFQNLGAVPDLVASAKAAGNGHPLGFLACRREIADSFAATSSFFSTAGGNPVSCRIGEAVLDVIADEGLRENAVLVGDRIARGLAGLAARHPVIGATYGLGLYQGIDLVEGAPGGRTPLRPDHVSAICERLLELGVIVQPTGVLGNVLKVKPPLCIGPEDADRYLACLDRVLTEHEELVALVASSGSA
jgi:4-aminobutyrate aminotransferase-like enzyme/Ser/Thr protein kinase RdoA (MazF antagonist)